MSARPSERHCSRRCSRAHIESTAVDEQELLVHGVSSEQVGDLAFAACVPIHELAVDSSSLEDIFLQLTSEPPT